MKRLIAVLVLSLIVKAPLIVPAGTDRGKAAAVYDVDDIYGADADTVALKDALSKAIRAGISAERATDFIREAARSERSPAQAAEYMKAVLQGLRVSPH